MGCIVFINAAVCGKCSVLLFANIETKEYLFETNKTKQNKRKNENNLYVYCIYIILTSVQIESDR